MRVVVLGGSGLIGTRLVKNLGDRGHEVVAASPSTGVNATTGEGLTRALAGARVVVDVANSPSFEDAAVMAFFENSARNLLPAEAAAGVRHHIALSVVGAERLPNSGYMRAKLAQESAIRAAGVPFTILRATQFFEFIGRIADAGTEGSTVRLTSARAQPVAADDVAAALAEIVERAPANGTLELAGPEPLGLDELARRLFRARGDARTVVTDANARYYGEKLNEQMLLPGPSPRIGPTRLEDWLQRTDARR